jgi:adenylate cyclase
VRTVRAKLVALVLACVAPAVIGAVYRSRNAERELLAQLERRVDRVSVSLAEEIDEYQSNARVALSLTEASGRFAQALANRDYERASRMVQRLVGVYKYRVILASDVNGALLAIGNAPQGPKSLAADSSPAFAQLQAGKPLIGLIQVRFNDAPGYALVNARPVRLESGQLAGAIALLTHITDRYLGHLGRKLNADLAVRANGRFIAASPDHPARDLAANGGAAVQREVGAKLFAIKSFRPPALQSPGLVIDVTASRDVTETRDRVRQGLYQELTALAVVLVIVLAFALWFAARLGSAVRAISDAARQVKAGTYATVPKLGTGDELQVLGEDFNQMVQGLKERDHLRETFGRYVTRQVADHLLQGNVNLGGQLIPVTILFSDIRSFTSISETMEPTAVLDFLNVYFSGMVESVLTHGGVVDKFMGDGIMAVFGAPVPQPDDPLHAVQAALEMRARLEQINVGFRERGLPEIRSGIGLHSGQVVAGNMGHVERMEYTVIGDPVNLASRLEGMTKELACDVILSEDLYMQVERHVRAEPLKRIKVKGRDQEVMVYRLIGLRAAGAEPPTA